MALFTMLDPAALAAIAARFDLGTVEAWEGIAAGTVNSNYRLRTARGEWFVRVNEGKSEEDVGYEAALVAYLAARGVPMPPAVMAAGGGRPYARTGAGLVTVFPWIAGEHRSPRRLGADETRAVGGALAALHAAAAGFAHRRASRYRFEDIVTRWRGLPPASADHELAAAIADVGDEIAWLEARGAERAALPTGVIHGDLFPDNVLFAQGGQGPATSRQAPRLVALLDFEQASDGAWAYDLAVCLCAWCYGDDFVPARAQALVAGYQAVRPLTPAERAGLWTCARAAAMRFTVTRITDVHLSRTTSDLVRATKDYRRYHARLARLRALGAAGFAALVGLD